MLSAFFVGSVPAQAVSRSDFQASTVFVSYPKLMKPGEVGILYVKFQNLGPAYWLNSGSYYVSVYHYDAVNRIESDSALATDAWVTKELAQKLPVQRVNPGEQVQFEFPIKAPNTVGKQHADFVLVAESIARMSGGMFSIDFDVSNDPASSPTQTQTATVSTANASVIQPRPNANWAGNLLSLSRTSWELKPGETTKVNVSFKNAGANTWRSSGTSFVSIYASTKGLDERDSDFRTSAWRTSQQAAVLEQTSVSTGNVGTFTIELKAPTKAGFYQEQFTLAAEDTAWMANGTFVLPITVTNAAGPVAATPDTSSSAPATTSGGTYSTTLLLKSTDKVEAKGGTSVGLIYGFKNTGTAPWNALKLKIIGADGTDAAMFRDIGWPEALTAASVSAVTKPGEIGFVSFKLKTPASRGSYTAKFQLYADDHAVDGGALSIPVTVTSDGAVSAQTTTPNTVSVTGLPSEPIVRVGLFKTVDDRMVIRAKYVPVNVKLNSQTVCTLNIGQEAAVEYNRTTQLYTLSGGPCSSQSAGVYVFETNDGISPMEMSDYYRPVSWLPGANDNTFRAKLELRYVPDTDNVWTINELPVEMYLRGLAETSDVSPLEYQKALLTAARTYANYHIRRNTKHGGIFHIDAKYDQVYRGYGAEARSPKIVQAVNETRGQIVTYNGELAITPYFSRSDGRTRSWGEVWYGGSNYPWLISVPVPWDAAAGRTLWGHGVGMSATGALDAANEGWDYQRILKYFYTGIDVTQVYQ